MVASFNLLIRFLLGAMWSWAGISKLADPDSRSTLPRPLQQISATLWLLGILELTLGGMLIFGVTDQWAAAATAVLVVVFTGWLLVVRLRGIKELVCPCFGSRGRKPIFRLIARNLCLLQGGVYLAVAPINCFDLVATGGPVIDLPLADVVAVIMTAAGLTILFIFMLSLRSILDTNSNLGNSSTT